MRIKIFIAFILMQIFLQNIDGQNIIDIINAGNIDSLKVLLENNPKLVNEKGFNQLTPLHFAIGGGNKDIIAYLLDNGADADAKDAEGRTPLFFAVAVTGRIDLAKLLINKGVDINAKDNSQRSILVWAAARGFSEIADYLLDLGALLPSPDENVGKELFNSAVKGGMIKIMDRMIAAGSDVLQKDQVGNNLLHKAAAGGSSTVIDRLIKAGVKITDLNNYGWTPLHYAAEGGYKETAALLIERGVNLNAQTVDGFTAYNLAVELDNKDVTELIVSKGADLRLPELQKFKGEYFGMKKPGTKPERFAPHIISRDNSKEYACTFSPDGKEFYFTKGTTVQRIMVSRLENNEWSLPKTVDFSAGYSAHEPHVTFDNKRIFWGWFKPVPEGESEMMQNYGIYMSERIDNGWSEAKYAGQGMFVSSSRDGRIYITGSDLSEVKIINRRFASYESLKGLENIKKEFGGGAHPCIAPDGSYIVFDVDGGSHLFVSFRKPDDTWDKAIDLADHGVELSAGIPSISPDGKYLFFGNKGDIYWVSTKLILKLRINR
jgi:ankyrin repeat protein